MATHHKEQVPETHTEVRKTDVDIINGARQTDQLDKAKANASKDPDRQTVGSPPVGEVNNGTHRTEK